MDVVVGEREIRTHVSAEWCPFGLSLDDRRRHIFAIGRTGTGKSTLLRNLLVQDIAAGRGLMLLDPHGDLAEELLDYVPPSRIEDVIYVAPADLGATRHLPAGSPHTPRFGPTRGYAKKAGGSSALPADQAIRFIKLYHRQIYKYAFHRPKLAMLRDSREHRRFAGIADFLERVPVDCPHELFHDSERASQTPLAKIKTSRLIVVEKENAATRMAELVIPTVGDNRLRHEALQRFMLANDSTTLAIEVPIWLAPETIRELEREHRVALMPEGASGALTGHIDFLQVRNRAVHILDYKPDARTNRPIAQLTVYALALTKLVPGLRLFDIKCAWFNEEEYCEFFPRTLLARQKDQTN